MEEQFLAVENQVLLTTFRNYRTVSSLSLFFMSHVVPAVRESRPAIEGEKCIEVDRASTEMVSE